MRILSCLALAGLTLVSTWGCSCSDDDEGPGPSTDAGSDAVADASDGAADSASDTSTPADGGSDAAPDANADGGDAMASWKLPACTQVTGTAAVTFSNDEGATLAATDGTLTGTVYTMGLVALEAPNTLLAASADALLRSEDSGCTWTNVASLPSTLMILERGRGDRAFGWVDNAQPLVRIDGTTVTPLKNPVMNTLGFAADPADPDRARLGGGDGTVWETTDGGAIWDPIGVPPLPSTSLLAYRFRFDPNNLDHILFGAATDGAWVSFDGAKTWTKSTGLAPSGKANAFELAVSPADSNVVWVEGINLDENLAGTSPSEGRHIWRSTDGGKSFVPVVDHQAGVVQLTNGLPLVAHPSDPNVVYFEFGTYYAGYGTDLFRYDAGANQLTQTHNPYDDILALAFSPADPSLIYLGISSLEIQ